MINDIPCQNIESCYPYFEERIVDFPLSHEEDSRLDDETLDDLFLET
jgi:hypothetical protein